MAPEMLARYLEVAKKGGAVALDLEAEGFKLRAAFAGPEQVARRPGPREVEGRLGEVDESVLYGSAGGQE
mgnify:CR=1 FL=1